MRLHIAQYSLKVCTLFFLALLFCSSQPTTIAEEKLTNLSSEYGFRKLEIFKLTKRSSNMLAGDLNNDGLTDLVLIDNSHSRIDLLQQRRNKPTAKEAASNDVNQITDDWRFKHRKIPVDREITSMILGDFNNDQRIDIAYLAKPDRLVIRYQPENEKEGWKKKITRRLPETAQAQWSISAGDMNADGKTDLAILGQKVTYLLKQQADGSISLPEKILNTTPRIGLLQLKDFNGNGRIDMGYISRSEGNQEFCVRLQSPQGKFGPELQFKIGKPRGISFENIDQQPGTEILTVESRTNRVKVFQMKPPVKDHSKFSGRLTLYGFGQSASRQKRDLALGDFNGDGLTDAVVTDPSAAQVILFQQQTGTGLGLGKTFPGLSGVHTVRAADFNGDGRAELMVVSGKEKVLALSELKEGRLTFPQTISTSSEPLAIDLADINKDGKQDIIMLLKDKKSGSSKKSLLVSKQWQGNNQWKETPLTKEPLSLNGKPERLVCFDVNRDGKLDYLIFLSLGRGQQLFITHKDGKIEEVKEKGGIGLGKIEFGAFSQGKLDQPVIMVSQKSFTRNVKLNDKQQWQVIDQYNASESKSKLAGSATINLDGKPGNEIVLIDTGIKKLRILKKENKQYQPWQEVELGSFPYTFNRVVDLNGDGKEDLLLFGRNTFAVLYAGNPLPQLKEIASFESKIKKTYFADIAAGDINGDGQTDLAVIDTRSHYIELLNVSPKKELRHALHFKVFQEKGFRGGTSGGSEPRETLIQDITGDGRKDLILLIHDRVIIYPQDDGK